MFKYNIRFINFISTKFIINYIKKKVSKLEKYFIKSFIIKVNIKLQFYNKKNFKIEITIFLKEVILKIEKEVKDIYYGINLVVSKMERQLHKFKTKINRKIREINLIQKKKDNKINNIINNKKYNESFKIIKKKKIDLKLMDYKEAILQMNLLNHNFFIFKNSYNDKISIIYFRKSNNYGIIDINK